jgi:hypothetical protein
VRFLDSATASRLRACLDGARFTLDALTDCAPTAAPRPPGSQILAIRFAPTSYSRYWFGCEEPVIAGIGG